MIPPLYIGIDAGGTKTALCASTSDNGLSYTMDGPGANFRRDGLAATTSRLSKLIQDTIQMYGRRPEIYICAGIAGAAGTEAQASIKKEITSQFDLPSGSVLIKADASIAYYAAHKDHSGILVITGTGSIIWGRTKTGQMVRAGGWGALLGDEGGGFRIGLAALRALSMEMDGGPTTLLSTILCEHYGLCKPSEILDFTYQEKDKIPTLASFVFEAALLNDDIALGIVRDQVLALAQSLKFLLLSHPHISPKLVYMGGLTNNELYVEHLKREMLLVHPDLEMTRLILSPAEAALHLARKLAG